MKEADIKKKKKNHHKYATLPKSHSALAQSRKSKGCFSVRSYTNIWRIRIKSEDIPNVQWKI